MRVVIKRAYDEVSQADGYRVLVDRLWPRGLRKEALALDEWDKDVAPSPELRRWFDHSPERFGEFSARYQDELANSTEPRALLGRAKGADRITLVYAAKDPEINHARVLRRLLKDLTDKS
ncbi:MAG TPA: DUF488 family protein [Candidatus Saccharimonadales bacterium]|nr:DUF488 family protein [Candidatus Saccharimonadales bacterium]